MNLIQYFKTHGKDMGCRMWEIWNGDNVYHLAESSRPNTKPRFMINGYYKDEDEIIKGLELDKN